MRLLLAVGGILAVMACVYFTIDALLDRELYTVQSSDLTRIDVETPDEKQLESEGVELFYFDSEGKLLRTVGPTIYDGLDTQSELKEFVVAQDSSIGSLSLPTGDGGTVMVLQDRILYSYTVYAAHYNLYVWIGLAVATAATITILLLFVRAAYGPVRRDLLTVEQGLSGKAGSFQTIDPGLVHLTETRSLVKRYNSAVQEIDRNQRMTREAVEARDLIVSNLAHDLKSPITVLKGYSEVLGEEPLSEEERRRYTSYICRSAGELNDLVSMLFEQIRYRSADPCLVLAPLDVCKVLRDSCANYYLLFEKRGFGFEADLPDRHFPVLADKLALERVFANLLQNVLAHNDDPCTVTVSCTDEDGKAVLRFADNGRGVPDEALGRIFEPFYQGDPARTDAEHGGLGLYVVRQSMENMSGAASAAKRPGGGLVVTLTLPLQENS